MKRKPKFDILKDNWIIMRKLKATQMEKLIMLSRFAGIKVPESTEDYMDDLEEWQYIGYWRESPRYGQMLDRFSDPDYIMSGKTKFHPITLTEVRKLLSEKIKERKT